MAMDNVATMGKINYEVIKRILEKFCPDRWEKCFEVDRRGNPYFSMTRADELFRDDIPQKLCDWLRLIHNLGNRAGRDYVERESRLYKFSLDGKRQPGDWPDRDYIGWLLLHDDKDERTFEFLEKASFHKDTEKRSVYAMAKARKSYTKQITQLSAAQIESIKAEYATRLLKKRRIVESKIKAVRVMPFMEGDRLHVIIRYPGARGAQVGCTDDGDWKSYVFSPACWVDFIVYTFGGNLFIDMNTQEKEQEHYKNIRMVLGEVMLGDPGAFEQVKAVVSLDPIGTKPLKDIFNRTDEKNEIIKNLESLRIHAVEYRVYDSKLKSHIIRRSEAPNNINLLNSEELEFMESPADNVAIKNMANDLIKIVVKYKVYADPGLNTLELSARGEKKYPPRHAHIIEPWLKAKGFSTWMNG